MFGSRSFKLSSSPRRTMSGAALALSALLAACGGGGGGGGGSYVPVPTPPAEPSPPSPPSPPPPPVDMGPLYDFTEIGLPGITFGVVDRQGIANGGLVAGTSLDGSGVSRAFLYNGKTNIDLGTFGGTASRAFAVNRCGQVAGWGATESGIPHAFFYDGTLHDLGTLGGAESWGVSISTCGKVAGWAVTGAGQQHAFYYDGKTMRDLGTFGGTLSGATDVNSAGQVVGYALAPDNARLHAFLYDARTGAPIQDVGPADRISQAIDINEAGQVAISTRDADGLLRAFRYDAGAPHDLGLLPDSQGSEPHAINAAGQVVGYVYYPDGRQVAFLHDGTTMRSLGTLNGGRFSDASAINAAGLAVGYAVDGPFGSEHAAAWGPGYGLVDLNTRVKDLPAGIELLTAVAVADDGAIAVRTRTGLGLLRPRK
jgi:probable HAF family extracellular repeat protein